MKRYWNALENWLAGRTERERIALLGAFVCVVPAFAGLSCVEPALGQRAALIAHMTEQARMLAAAQAQQAETARVLGTDPNLAVRERVAAVRRELAGIDGELGQLQRTLLAPDRMAGVLQQLLGKDPRVRLMSMRNLPPEPIDGGAQAVPAAGVPRHAQVFRHGIEVVVEGGYLDLVGYLDTLEQQPWQLFWGQAVLQADYPRATLRLTLYTLSLDPAWLVV